MLGKIKNISINFMGSDKIENFFRKFCEKVLSLPLFEAFEHE